jgi:hypothetical protein
MSAKSSARAATRLAAMRLRTRYAGVLAMLAVAASGCGSGDSGFPNDIPPTNADGLLAYLHSVQVNCQNGDRFATRTAAQDFATAVDRLPSSVDPRVRTVLRRGADNLTTLVRDPQQCATGPTGATGVSGAQTETTTTSTATTTTTTARPRTTATTPTTTASGAQTTATGGGAGGGTAGEGSSGGGGGSGTATVTPPGGSGGVVAPGPGTQGGGGH